MTNLPAMKKFRSTFVGKWGSCGAGIVYVSLFVVLTSLSETNGLGKSDYPCPTDCDCFVFSNERDNVHVRCAIDVLNPINFNFSVISSNHTAGLYLQCDSDFSSYGKNFIGSKMFSHLKELQVLEIHDCQITDITRLSLFRLNSLTRLRIVRAKHLTFHEEVFREMPNLKTLEISGSQFVQIPPTDLCQLSLLNSVNFTNSRIRDISEVGLRCFVPLSSLSLMDFTSNFLTQLPSDYSIIFPNIEQIYLNDNRISRIRPHTFHDLPALRLLSLSKNFLASLPSDFLTNCTNMTGIGLSQNELSRIPKGLLRRMPKLTIFEIRNTFVGDSVWPELEGVTALEILDLSYAVLNYINVTVMANLRQLKKLSLSGNRIRDLPNGVFQRQSKLELLYLDNNDVTQVNKNSFVGMRSLRGLTLAKNNISNIHNAAFRKQSESMRELLNLSFNDLMEMPRAVSVLGKLTSLDLSNNRISSIDDNSLEGLESLREFHLSSNKLEYIPQNVFQKCLLIVILNLSNNKITAVQNNAFGQLSMLRYLWLEENQISDIGWVFTNVNNLQFLNLSNNEIDKPISPYLFPTTLEYLYLAGNQISAIQDGSFENMAKLNLLDLRGNNLTVISSLAFRVSLKSWQKPYMLLRGNPLSCTCEMAWLKYLVTGNQKDSSHYFQISDYSSLLCHAPEQLKFHFVADTPQKDFVCYYTRSCLLRECRCCYFEGCDCKSVCPNNCTCYHDQQWSVHVVDCQSSGLTSLPRFLPQTMTKLRLDGNNLGDLDRHSFLARHSLSMIYLNGSHIRDLDNKTFHGLPKLKVLYLNNNNIDYLVAGVFNGLSLLEELYLDHNELSSVSSGVLDSLVSLKKLTLQGNELSHIESLFLPQSSVKLEVLLGNNPLVCACSQIGAIQEMLNSYATRVKDLSNLTCIVIENEALYNTSGPSEMIDNVSDVAVDLFSNDLTDFGVVNVVDVVNNLDNYCPNISSEAVVKFVPVYNEVPQKLSQIHIVLITIAVVVLVLTCFALILLAKRELILVWLYTKFGMRLCRHDSQYDCDKKYDAFISYSSKDEYYVVHELAPYLEQCEPSYKLCLHYRDFPVGASIAESIIEAVESSRRTVLILSSNFLQSEWCRYEFQSAHHQVLKDRLNRLIVILLNDFPFEKLDPDLKLYLKTKTYLKLGDPWFWQKLKYALPDVAKPKPEPKPRKAKRDKKRLKKNGIGPTVYVVFGSSSSLHIYDEVQPV